MIAFESYDTAAGTTSLTFDPPSGIQDGDILLMLVGTANTAELGNLPAGFTRFAQVINTNGASFFAWKRASSESGTYLVDGLATLSRGCLMRFSGCIASGNPINVSASRANASTARGTAGITTTVVDTMIVSAVHLVSNFDVTLWTADDPATLTEKFHSGTTGIAVSAAVELKATAGATGATSYYFSNAENEGLVCALTPIPIFLPWRDGMTRGMMRGAFRGL